MSAVVNGVQIWLKICKNCTFAEKMDENDLDILVLITVLKLVLKTSDAVAPPIHDAARPKKRRNLIRTGMICRNRSGWYSVIDTDEVGFVRESDRYADRVRVRIEVRGL